MTTKTKNILKWRLTKLPTAEELLKLVEAKIITHEEAKEVLFSEETQEERDEKDLKEEIKFLRDLVEELSQNQRTRVVEVIREVAVPYRKDPWYRPYDVWCSVTSGNSGNFNTAATANGNVQLLGSSGSMSFRDISSFN